MFTRHVSRHLAGHLDGVLDDRESARVERHIAGCAACREERERIGQGMALLEHLPMAEAPEAIWSSIEAALDRQDRRRASWVWQVAVAIAVFLAVLGGSYWFIARRAGTKWDVATVQENHVRTRGRIGAGEWLETNSGSSATLQVGAIGSIDVGPNTRMRVVTAGPGEHRIALAHGEIHAKISAPPKLFFVDTASGTAIDLGCEYTLKTDEQGFGTLKVTRGWVSFQWKGLESLVPAGASCRTQPNAGPGIPYFDDAPADLKQALEAFGFEKSIDNSLHAILTLARARDTLSLWHLLSRVNDQDRAHVYDRIAALTPVPAGVSRDQVMRLDPDTLRRWKEELAWTW